MAVSVWYAVKRRVVKIAIEVVAISAKESKTTCKDMDLDCRESRREINLPSSYPETVSSARIAAKGRYIRRSAATSVGIGTTKVGERINSTQAATKPAGRRSIRK